MVKGGARTDLPGRIWPTARAYLTVGSEPPVPHVDDHLCPKCGKRWTGVYASIDGGYDCMCNRCGYAEHRALPNTAPEPERFWCVAPMLTNASMWLCVTVDKEGQMQTQYGPPRMTEAAARDDGRASGLPEWTGGVK